MEQTIGPLLAKSLRNMIRHKFMTEYGYSDAIPLAEFITDDLMELIQSVVFDANNLDNWSGWQWRKNIGTKAMERISMICR
jgi:hypothetical protein